MNNLDFMITTIYLSLTLSSCNKIEFPLELPMETQVGANTFGCKVNGEIWRIRTLKEISHGNGGVRGYIADSILHITAFNLGFWDKIPEYDIQLLF